MNRYILFFILLTLLSCSKKEERAEGEKFVSNSTIEVNSSLKSDMVIQQNSTFAIKGKGTAGEKVRVTCSWAASPVIITVDNNSSWSVPVTTPAAAMEPVNIIVEGKIKKTFSNILVGEVWICAGQSNMQWYLKNATNGTEEVATATYPKIRLLNISRKTAVTPQEEFDAQWLPCVPSTAGDFSAVGYFFGKNLFNELNTPIGLISVNWGNTAIEVWMNSQWVNGDSELLDDAFTRTAGHDDGSPSTIGSAYNAMIHPLKGIPIAGVIWYQGENNQGSPYIYPKFLKTMIEGWRNDWQKQFAFYICQIAPYKRLWNYKTYYSNPAMRFSQAEATKTIAKTAIEVNDDIADINDIHPRNKKDVGLRLASLALGQTYGKTTFNKLRSPIYKEMSVVGNKIIIRFNFVDTGFKTTDGNPPSLFEICGEDKVFYAANAKISGSEIELTSPDVSAPVAARMGWSYTKVTNLRTTDNLPVSVFKTYQWADNTEEK